MCVSMIDWFDVIGISYILLFFPSLYCYLLTQTNQDKYLFLFCLCGATGSSMSLQFLLWHDKTLHKTIQFVCSLKQSQIFCITWHCIFNSNDSTESLDFSLMLMVGQFSLVFSIETGIKSPLSRAVFDICLFYFSCPLCSVFKLSRLEVGQLIPHWAMPSFWLWDWNA